MKGYFKITAESNVREGMSTMTVDVQLSHVSVADKMMILKNVCKAIEIDEKLVTFFLAAERAGLLETESEDCERGESECDCDKESADEKPEVKVMAMDMDMDEFLDMLFGGDVR